jgi:hypothetical protein
MDQRTIVSLFESAERGDAAASEALFAALYTELHRMARRELARRGGQVTLSVTTLLHEASRCRTGTTSRFPTGRGSWRTPRASCAG